MTLRVPVLRFAMAMERRLRIYDGAKAPDIRWSNRSYQSLLNGIIKIAPRLGDAVEQDDLAAIRDLTADMANYLMMIYTKASSNISGETNATR